MGGVIRLFLLIEKMPVNTKVDNMLIICYNNRRQRIGCYPCSLKGLVNYMKYELTFVCEQDGDRIELGYDVEFFYDENQYGNGTYMYCKNHDRGLYSPSYDIRYDRSYSADHQKEYILNWALNNWNGENGSYRITEIAIKEIA